ncbi:uncharacterized protein [Gossypium hirsutum]|uniref:RNase H type-1 domain-containing protein n=1 Tax=Gossypium hirsutum TaxID=3635 RepID=A0A1U8NMM2_GOSHI|nr:uncharacterized protein LOC107949865 [Gossypium hirsutum]
MIIPHISKTFISGGTIHSERMTLRKGIAEEILGNLSINAIYEEEVEEGNSSGIRPYEPGSVLINWTAEEIPKVVKGSAITDFLTSRALEDYEPLNFDFPNEDLMYVATAEKDFQEDGNGIGAVLVSPDGDHYPFTSKLDFDCINNMAKYEACIMEIRATIERKIKVFEVYGDSALEFDDITFCYLPRDENQMADALATLASRIKVNKQEDMKPIQMSIYEAPTHCYNIDDDEEKDDHPWYHDILRYVKNHEYPGQATENKERH